MNADGDAELVEAAPPGPVGEAPSRLDAELTAAPLRALVPVAGSAVLLVEDNRNLGPAMQKFLQVRGFESVWMEGVQPALDALNGGGLAVVITDFDLPDGTGLDVVEAASIPVIVCTGRAEPEYHDRLVSAGAQVVVTKPFGLEELESALVAATVST